MTLINWTRSAASRLLSFLKSKWSFYLAILLFGINSTWIALSAGYPMAFDENFHLGLIKLYATRMSPFWSAQPPGEAVFGAVARDPSYLYHYLMSFPYRILEYLVPSEFAQVLFLRFSSIVIFGIGIYVFRKILLEAGFSKALTHASLLVFVLIPIVPLLAAHINYDNLIFTLLALTIWQTQLFAKRLTQQKQFDVSKFIVITMLCIFGSLVKYAYLPFALGIVIYLGIKIFRHSGFNSKSWTKITKSFRVYSPKILYLLLIPLIMLSGLFLERYAVNTIRYSTPTPECNQVLSVDECLAYGPWRRNYYTRKAKIENRLETNFSQNPVRYLVTLWLSEITFQLFFAIDGPKSDYQVGKPFRILRNSSVLVLILGTGLIIYHNRYLRKKYRLMLFGIITITYGGSLIALNYSEFINLGYPFAIQGRYLIPILPLIIAVMVAAYSKTIGKQRTTIKLSLFSLALLVLLTQGGGAGTYILRSKDSWYWPNNISNDLNHNARNILKIINTERNI